MKLGRIHVLHMNELIDAQESINIVDDAFNLRRQELSGGSSVIPLSRLPSNCVLLDLFDQRRLTVSQELRDFAYGMVRMVLFPMKSDSIILLWL